MSLMQHGKKLLTAAVLILVLTITTACGGSNVAQVDRTTNQPAVGRDVAYKEIERGNTSSGQNFASWVVQKSGGLVQDAYVRDNDKLGVVISPQVKPTEVRPLTKSLLQGFSRNFPNKDLTVLVYAPDKKLILSANYDVQSKKVEYK